MSAYIKFVCDYCGDNSIDFWGMDSIETTRSCLEDYGWDTSEADMCEVCRPCNV